MASMTDGPDAAGARARDVGLPGYGLRDAGIAGLLYRCDLADARAHRLHVVEASALPARNQVLLCEHLRGHPDDVARCGGLEETASRAA